MAFPPDSGFCSQILERLAEGLVLVDPKGVILFVNPALEKITGYRRQELVGQTCAPIRCPECFATSPPGTRERCRLLTEGEFPPVRCVVPQKDGSLRHIVKQGVLLRDDSGQVVAGVELFLDITELVHQERLVAGMRRQLRQEEGFYGMLGKSPLMLELFSLVRRVAPSTSPVLITGESGTGKEMVARLLHRLGPWPQAPFLILNCRSMPLSLLEQELFGPSPASGAPGPRGPEGRPSGDLVLKEVGDLPLSLQARLLAFLAEGPPEKRREEGWRLIATTSQDPDRLLAEGRFLKELFYRLNVIPLRVPALRERPEDIPLLAAAFLERAALKSRKTITGFSPGALEVLVRYPWPGNVRELLNVVDYAVLLCPEGLILSDHLPAPLREAGLTGEARGGSRRGRPRLSDREALLKALAESGGKRGDAARILGVSRVTLWKWLKKYKISLEKDRLQK